jgi:hypothetical protein
VALVGLVFSILAGIAASLIILGFLGVVPPIPAVVALTWLGGLMLASVGVVCSAFGLRSLSHKGVAVGGLILSILSLVVFLLLTALVIIAAIAGSHL